MSVFVNAVEVTGLLNNPPVHPLSSRPATAFSRVASGTIMSVPDDVASCFTLRSSFAMTTITCCHDYIGIPGHDLRIAEV